MFWGLSPALDLQEEFNRHSIEENDTINILLLGSVDARHVIKTLAQSYRHKPKKINIFIVESCLEQLARQFMLLGIALEPAENLGLLEKTRLFMEIYGNTLLRPPSSKYAIFKAGQLIRAITDSEYCAKMFPNLSLSGIKYRERDYMEMLLQFWRTGNTNRFDACELWDRRVRQHLGVRYDCRSGVFDWDYSMRLKDVGGATVSLQEYRHFRKTGVAFTWLDAEAARPNCTLAAGVLQTGQEFTHRGYLGDITVGPYVAYGLDCEDEDMLKTSDGRHLKRATDITERNLMRMFHELRHRCEFDPRVLKGCGPDHNLGVVTIVEQSATLSEASDVEDIAVTSLQEKPSLILDYVNVAFLSPSALKTLPEKECNRNKFDVVFSSHIFVDKLTESIFHTIKNDGLIILENKTFFVDHRKDDIREFAKKFDEITEKFNCNVIGKFDPLLSSYVKLQLKRSNGE